MALTHFGTDLAIDLGTANTCVYAKGRGVILNEPSLIAFNAVSGVVEAVGGAAREMLGRNPGHLRPVRPIKDGVIADFDATEKMLAHFIRKTHQLIRAWFRPRVAHRRAHRDHAGRAARRERLRLPRQGQRGVPRRRADGGGRRRGLPIADAAGNMIIDIGGGTSDIAVISLTGVVIGRSVRVGGDAMDEAIIHYMKKRHDLLVGERTAEAIKIEIGSATPLEKPLTMEVKGRHLSKGVPVKVMVTDAEIREALAEPLKTILRVIRETLDQIPPELSSDIYDRGVALCGGGSLLRNLDKRIRDETQLPVQMVDDPLSCVVIGAGKMLSDDTLLKKLSVQQT